MKINEITFSPTGGTKKVADIISKELGDNIEEIDLTKTDLDYKDLNIKEEDISVIAVPSYGGRVPEVAVKRLRKLNGQGSETILVAVYGNRDYDDTLIELRDKSIDSDFSPVAGIIAIAEHSILPQYAAGRPDKEDVAVLKDFVRQIKEKETSNTPVLPGNRPYLKSGSLPLIPKPGSNCNKCGVCVSLCPVNAIDSKNFKADKSKCFSCMRCIKICPNNSRKVNKLLTTIAGLALKKAASNRKENELFI